MVSIELHKERASFEGTLVAILAYGALLMLYFQLTQVLLSRPKRGKTFFAIVMYSSILFPLATLAISGMLKFAEMSYVDNRGVPIADYMAEYSSKPVNVMGQVSTTLVPWIGDVLMIYRLSVVWDRHLWVLILPTVLYLSRVAMSIPLLIAETRPTDPSKSAMYSTAFYSICVSFNTLVTVMISLRIYMMRKKVEIVMGKLHASFYTSFTTILVESGAFFTAWAMTYVILSAQKSIEKEIFLLPYTHVLGITRMLIILRMAQDRAWSKDLVTATDNGVMDWHVSSSHTLPLHDVPASSVASLQKPLPRKFREDALPS